MGALGELLQRQYDSGNRQSLSVLMAEEDNLLAAWRLAREYGWWASVISTMQGLRTLYGDTGRGAAWRRLVETVVPDFVDPATDGPLPGREEDWSLGDRISRSPCSGGPRLGRGRAAAARLRRLGPKRARPALETAPETRDYRQRHAVRTLTVSVHELAEIQREKDDPACVGAYREAFDLANAIGDTTRQATCAFNLGRAYRRIAALRNLDEAERWVRKSLDLRPPGDAFGRGKSLSLLGTVFYRAFHGSPGSKATRQGTRPSPRRSGAIVRAGARNVPETAITDRGVMHNQLGNIYGEAGDIDHALRHYQQDIRYSEEAGDQFGAGETRYNVALALLDAGRLDDARAYAEAALANYQTFGERAAAEIQRTERLIAAIDKAAAEKRGGA